MRNVLGQAHLSVREYGGLPGMGVDASTGAVRDLHPNPLMVTLEPGAPAASAEAASTEAAPAAAETAAAPAAP